MSDTPPSVDGISTPPPPPPAPAEKPTAAPSAVATSRMKNILLVMIGVPYIVYIVWLFFLLSFLPRPTGGMVGLVQIGVWTSVLGALALLALGAIAFFRVRDAKDASDRRKFFGLLKVGAVIVPGLLLSILVPFAISREPNLYIRVVDPVSAQELVAPLAVTFSLEDAVEVLAKSDLSPIQYEWDFDGDGVKNDETVVPTVTAVYERQGTYAVVARLTLNDGSERRITRRLTIPNAVFSVSPYRPVVNEPVRFSVEHLLTEGEEIVDVQWDFTGNGEVDETLQTPSALHTFPVTGPVTVTAVVKLNNQTQRRYDRVVTINEPEPLPFPVSISTEPRNLLSPAPFGAIYTLNTEEELREIVWDFGDGEQATGARVGHTFQDIGVYRVSVEARSVAGPVAKLGTIVRVTDLLRLPDLTFDGSPKVDNRKVTGEVPVTLSITPRTSQPLIDFTWEAPDATQVQSTDTTLQAVYRREGTYTATLLASGPDGKAVRIPITVEVQPPSSQVAIKMTPEGGTAPLLVRFDASETSIPDKTITGFEWLFSSERGSIPQQRGAQVEYLFEQPGTYTVTLRALTTTGETFDGQKTIVVRAPILDACFLPSRTSGAAPLGVSFNMSCSTGNIASMEWDFGDDSQSDVEDPIHVFERPGSYTVILTITDENGTVSTDSVTITAQ